MTCVWDDRSLILSRLPIGINKLQYCTVFQLTRLIPHESRSICSVLTHIDTEEADALTMVMVDVYLELEDGTSWSLVMTLRPALLHKVKMHGAESQQGELYKNFKFNPTYDEGLVYVTVPRCSGSMSDVGRRADTERVHAQLVLAG